MAAKVSREVVVTGFGRTDTHELPNSLTWGPDGWLYGLNGVFNQCRIRSNNGREVCLQLCFVAGASAHAGISRSSRKERAILTDWPGTSEGSAIVEACHWANDHLFHFVETGHYQRQGGSVSPFTFPLGSITDHGHQKTAYCGIAYLDTDAYPEPFRRRICVATFTGRA
jgi:hypothetical protein